MTTTNDLDALVGLLERAHAHLDARPLRYPRRRRRPYVFITAARRNEAIRRSREGETYSAIGRSMGLSHSTIRRAVLGITQERPR